jgi:hypothetical protein
MTSISEPPWSMLLWLHPGTPHLLQDFLHIACAYSNSSAPELAMMQSDLSVRTNLIDITASLQKAGLAVRRSRISYMHIHSKAHARRRLGRLHIRAAAYHCSSRTIGADKTPLQIRSEVCFVTRTNPGLQRKVDSLASQRMKTLPFPGHMDIACTISEPSGRFDSWRLQRSHAIA